MNSCLCFALNRGFKYGGYLVIRKSRFGPFQHFIWCASLRDAEIEHFVPKNPKHRLVPPLFFEGYIKRDDKV